MSKKPTDGRSGARLGALDALRLFAALVVVGFHFTAANSSGWNGRAPEVLKPVGQWMVYGRLGVPLFFVISGFVLLMSSWGRDVPSFVASRVGRLFPAYWVAVAFSIVLALYLWPENMTFAGKQVTTATGLLNLTMFQEAFGRPDIDGPYWTLWYEARFYLLIGVLMLIGMTRGRILAFCALWPIVASVAQNVHSPMLQGFLMPDYAPFFAGGMLLYLIYRDGHDLFTWLLVGMQLLFALNFSLDYYMAALPTEVPWPPTKPAIAIVTAACFGLVALVTMTPLGRLSARWMTVAGALTYPVYLIHQNLGLYIIHSVRGSVGPWTAVGLAVGASLIAGLLLHHLVEKPFGPRLRRAALTSMRSTGRIPGATRTSSVEERPVAVHGSEQSVPAVPGETGEPAEVPANAGHPTVGQPVVPLPRVRPATARGHSYARARESHLSTHEFPVANAEVDAAWRAPAVPERA